VSDPFAANLSQGVCAGPWGDSQHRPGRIWNRGGATTDLI